jgi:hypothetical protein
VLAALAKVVIGKMCKLEPHTRLTPGARSVWASDVRKMRKLGNEIRRASDFCMLPQVNSIAFARVFAYAAFCETAG